MLGNVALQPGLTRLIRACILAVSSLLVAAPALASDLTNLTDRERAALGNEIRQYILDNPELVFEAIILLQNAEPDNRFLVESYSDELFADENSWQGGNLDGDITVVEFLDYRCGYCRMSQDIVSELVGSDGNIRLVLKEFPILGIESEVASRAAISVLRLAGNSAYKAVHDKLMSHAGPFDAFLIAEVAEMSGLEPAALEAEMSSEPVGAILFANRTLASELGISGTPAFVIGGELMFGFMTLEQMAAVVEQERTKVIN